MPENAFTRSTLTSGLVALFVETLLFGGFAVLYGICTWVLLLRNKAAGRSKRDILLFVGSTFMFALALIHVALDVYITLVSYVAKAGSASQMSDSLTYLNGLAAPHGAAKFGLYVTQTLIGDGFMIYRAYVVWSHNWRVAVGLGLLLAGEVVFGYYISFAGPAMMAGLQTSSCVNALVEAFFVISVATNLLSTGLIMRRVLWSDIAVQEHTVSGQTPARSVKWRVVESVLQSAAIYSVASISLAVTSFVSPAIGFPVCHSVFPSVIGIAFLLIVMRIGFNAAPGAEFPRHSMHIASNSMSTSTSCPGLPDSNQEGEPLSPCSPCSMRSMPIAIHVSVSTTSDVESLSESLEKEECPMRQVFQDVHPASDGMV